MARKMTKESLYDELRRRIITMDLAPGADLDEAELSAAYGMSRTPVREVLIHLQCEGLVVSRRNRGASVAPLDVTTLQSWFEAARMMHRAIVRLACWRRTQTDIEAIREAMYQFESAMAGQQTLEMIYANERFHDRIGQAARNPHLYGTYRRILTDHERISQLCYSHEIEHRAEDEKQLTLDQHRQLFDAIVARDSATAEQISEAHLSLCRDGLRNTLEGAEQVLADVTLDAG